jgi:predicted DCC family thiol-disulfide oxidoreductase YuxK
VELPALPTDKKIILFDGVCNLCDSVVQYVIRHDKKDVFRFAALQSETGVKILNHIGISKDVDSIILYEPGIAYHYKSDAALEIAKYLGWPVLSRILKLIPSFVRNPVYDYIARNRYKWYGKKESCMMPTPEMQSKFI